MGRRKKTEFGDSAYLNNMSYLQYFNRLTELAISCFEWKNLPDSVDERFLEYCLFNDGFAIFFKDEDLDYLCLQCMIRGKLNVYRIPIERTAYATNGYNMELNDTNSVIIYNNMIHTNSTLDVEMFSKRLYNLDRCIDVNANAQKTPVLIICKENERLTMNNLYKEYDGNAPVIWGDKGLDIKGLSVLKTDAPYVADKLYELKTELWNEALTYLGISNVSVVKKERLVKDEVSKNQGGVVASRFSRLMARKQACEQINKMFGLNIDVNYRDGLFEGNNEGLNDSEGGEANE